MEFLVETREDMAPVVHLTFEGDDRASTSPDTLIDALALADNAGPEAPIWVHGTTDAHRSYLESNGFTSNRTLLQMRCPLPATPSSLDTRAFTTDDIDDFVRVNNRAFDWHPEQSGKTPEWVHAELATDWFNAQGFRLHHIDGELAGFCWTKVHTEPDALGEIYVIAVDPAFHGRGLGTQMTLAGLDWLHGAGLTTAMLYVESDNEPAVATYEKIGFTTHRTDTLWRRQP